jgi:Skp family chaperone for outer membrane proteins
METNEKRAGIAILALVLALLALGVAGAAYVSAPKPVPDPTAGLEALRNDIAGLRADLAKSRQELEARVAELAKSRQELEARVAELAARKEASAPLVALAAPVAADQAALRKQMEEQVREALLQAGGNVRWEPATLPQPVKDALAKVAPGVEIIRAEQRQRNDQAYFRLKGRLKGDELDYRITPAGGILEADLPLGIVPAVVKDAATKAVAGFELVDATQILHDGAVAFDLGGRAEQKKYELRVSAEGKVINVEVHGQGRNARPQGGVPQKPPAPPAQENF